MPEPIQALQVCPSSRLHDAGSSVAPQPRRITHARNLFDLILHSNTAPKLAAGNAKQWHSLLLSSQPCQYQYLHLPWYQTPKSLTRAFLLEQSDPT
jgi:hypothetical protein